MLLFLMSQVLRFGTIPTEYRNKGVNNAVQSHSAIWSIFNLMLIWKVELNLAIPSRWKIRYNLADIKKNPAV